MFGDRFKFESPNIIDSGDKPPTPPAKRRTQRDTDVTATPVPLEYSIVNTSMKYGDARDNANKYLQDVEVSPTRGLLGSDQFQDERSKDEEDALIGNDDDDDDADGVEHPYEKHRGNNNAAKMARAYAANVLSQSISSSSDPAVLGFAPSESTRHVRGTRVNQNQQMQPWSRSHSKRKGSRALMIPDRYPRSDQPLPGRKDEVDSLDDSTPMKNFVCCCTFNLLWLIHVALVGLVVLIVILAVGMFPLGRDHQSRGQPDLSVRMEQTMVWLSRSGISEMADLQMPGTPQSSAALWISDIDPLQYNVPSYYHGESMGEAESYHFVQRYVLAVLFYALKGENWNHQLEFLSYRHECQWYNVQTFTDGAEYARGATCRGNEMFVTDILIPDNNLSGNIPYEIKHLTHLQLVSLSHNEIRGGIPQQLVGLTNLQYLDLGTNKLGTTVPAWLGKLSQLRLLGLRRNMLTGTLPESLSSLSNIVTLDLQHNFLEGKVDVVNNLTKLQYLYMNRNSFTGDAGEEHFLRGLTHIQEIDFSSNLLFGSFPQSLLERQYLKLLDISSNTLFGAFPENIRPNNVLEVLEVDGNNFTSSIPLSIDALSGLKHLDLANNRFSGTITNSIVNLRKLTYLSISKNDFYPGEIPAFLSALTDLRELSMHSCQLHGQIPSWFEVLSNLKYLNLQANKLTGSIPHSFWKLPDLSMLLLSDNTLQGTFPQSATESSELELLALQNNNMTGDAGAFCFGISTLKAFSFDCENAVCSGEECCSLCCGLDKEQRNHCFAQALLAALEENEDEWEHKVRSTANSFSPSEIFATAARNAG